MDIGHIIVYAIVPIIVVMATGFTAGKLGVFSQMDGMKFNKVVMKLIIMPGAMLLLGILFRMNPNHLLVLVIAGALPSCFSAIMVAEQCDSYIQEGTSLVTLTVILFMGMCPLWIYLTKLCTVHFLS